MTDWTVRHSSNFIASAKTIHAEFKHHYDLSIHATSPTEARKEAEEMYPRFDDFESFVQAVLDLKDGKSNPEEVLSYCEVDKEGLPIYALVVGRWRGLYRVDQKQKICDAISIDEMSAFVRFNQTLRGLFRRSV